MPPLILIKSLYQLPAPTSARPTQAQLEAGDYHKPRRRFAGFDVAIENPRGSVRRGRDRGGREWSISMRHDYGELLGTLGVDGDPVDCYLGPTEAAPTAYVITTMAPPAFEKVDEQKVMLGFNSEDEAREAFLLHYDNPRFFGGMVAMPLEEFRAKVMTTATNPRLLKARILFLKAGSGT